MKGEVPLFLTLFFLPCQLIASQDQDKVVQFDPDMFRNVSELITCKGYPVEDHTVQTSDGFVLSMQRIPHGRNVLYKQEKKGVVLLVHGMLGTSADWVLNFPQQSLGFILADERYDVWLANTRGNTYSRKHVKYTPHQAKFWDFCVDDLGHYDLPAMIDYILNLTGQKQLYYVGHSQGSAAAFALLSESPKYNRKIKLFVAFSPVVTFKYITCRLKYLFPLFHKYGDLLRDIGFNEILPKKELIPDKFSCDEGQKHICEGSIFKICGMGEVRMNKTRKMVYAAHIPAGSSVKILIHATQIGLSNQFSKFDYGKRNIDYYGQETPVAYNLSRITAPVALFWAMNDRIITPGDVHMLEQKLKSLVFSYCIPDPLFTHTDFTLGVNAHEVVYGKVLSAFDQY